MDKYEYLLESNNSGKKSDFIFFRERNRLIIFIFPSGISVSMAIFDIHIHNLPC